ncbi:uncharacterized protein PV09_01891 [Verruconis gallopava]|uniref:MYND-type domain-containing protein n=1 Tax=Verruconis gallopava TaxID=253628 RepID=A0A0D1Z4W9_9PEZI|nr:uncharacterized protein PV09_01891 [Verruconis gallopava]KIW07992.1 hypothetical protein PV09_01891 [Verruconis gallopava]
MHELSVDASSDIHPMSEKLKRKKSFPALRQSPLFARMGHVASLSKTPFRFLFKSSKSADDGVEPPPLTLDGDVQTEQGSSVIEDIDETSATSENPVWASSMLIIPRTHYFLFTRATSEASKDTKDVQPIGLVVKQPNPSFQLAALRAELGLAEPAVTTPGTVKLLTCLIQSGKRVVPLVAPDESPNSASASAQTNQATDTTTTATSGPDEAKFKFSGDLLFQKNVKAWLIVEYEQFGGLTAQYHILRRVAESVLQSENQIQVVDGEIKLVHDGRVRGDSKLEALDETLLEDVTSMITAPIQVGPLARYCNACNSARFAMRRCAACKSVFYCDVECCKADRQLHKVICGAVATSAVKSHESGNQDVV